MAMSDWSTTAASNGTALGINIAENCPAANVNNAIREMMAELRGAITTGSATISGNASVGGTLSVTGGMTFSGTLGVTGAVTLSSTLGVTGAGTFASTLTVAGAAILSSTLAVAGVTTINTSDTTGTLNVGGLLQVRGSGIVAGIRCYNTVGARDWRVLQDDTGNLAFYDATAGATRAYINSTGNAFFGQSVYATGNVFPGNDGQFYLGIGAGNAIVNVDSNDYYLYDRTNNAHTWYIGSVISGYISGRSFYEGTGLELGYKSLPKNAQTGNYTLAITDRDKLVYLTSGSATITIPPNSSVAFPSDPATTIVVINNGSASKTLARGSGVTLYLAGAQSDANRTLAAGAVATLIKVATDTWFVSGAGVS